ncbi:uncharacterized protein LOC142369994 [Odontesthes bonariensis]|uniref:uncharacterized protein LOC142369994 n=1 Tax=Odontesthes bonariensis TaxID=219752 RepID=UPI003F58A2C3
MAKLDQCTQKLMDVVSSRGGASGARIRQIKDMILEQNTIEMRREVAIRCLVVYLGEKEEDLFKEFGDNEEFETSFESHMMKIAIVGDRSTPGSDHWMTTIVVEGTKCLVAKDIPRSCALLMGIIYALNISYCKKLKYTFEPNIVDDNEEDNEEPEEETEEGLGLEPYRFEPAIASDSGSESESESSGDDDGDGRLQNADWCQCGNCAPMPTRQECVCCREIVQVADTMEAEGVYSCVIVLRIRQEYPSDGPYHGFEDVDG